MKAYKLSTNINDMEAGRMFAELGTEVLLIATPTKPHIFVDNYTINRLKEKGLLVEVDLLQETYIHPHLYKPIKKEVQEQLTKS